MADNLLPCPFCCGKAERVDITDGENAGGACISCTVCQASSNLEFGRKENFVSNWNRRDFSPMTVAAAAVVAAIAPQHAGIELAARFVEKRLHDYVSEHGSTDPDTGTVEYPSNGEEYVYELEEIIEGIRALATPIAANGNAP
jgi:hypothetical protein